MKYKVQENGSVINVKTGRKMKPYKVKGKWCVKAYDTNYYIHRMLWEQHFGPIESGKIISFKDNNFDNLKIENLYKTDNFNKYERTNGDYPYCFKSEGGPDWIRFTCKYKGKVLVRTKKQDYDTTTMSFGRRVAVFLDMPMFYERFAIDALAKVVPNVIVPLIGFEDEYEVHTNSKVFSPNGNQGVLMNKKNGRWVYFSAYSSTYQVKITANGERKTINLATYAWNSLNPDDQAVSVKFRCPDKPYFFDLIKIK